MPSNASLAVWCKQRNASAANTFEAHFNYWRLGGADNFRRSDGKPTCDYLEIGILLNSPADVEQIQIFLPVPETSFTIEDCCNRFRDASIAQGIFNEVFKVTTEARSFSRKIELAKESSIFCHVHSFSSDESYNTGNDLELQELNGGTLLTFTEQILKRTYPNNESEAPAYFRVRFSLDNALATETFVQRICAHDRAFQSGSEDIEYIDFRLNEARTLPSKIDDLMRSDRANQDVKLMLVAFLVALPIQSELTLNHTQYHKLRLLETAQWNKYIDGGIPQGMMVYHWKRNSADGISDFSAFLKLRIRRSNYRTICTYLTVAFLFGILGNLAANGIQYLVVNYWNQETSTVKSPPAAPETSLSPTTPPQEKP